MKESIDFFKFIKILKKKWLLLAFASLLGFLLSYGFTHYVIEPQYAAVTRMIVTRNYVDNQMVELSDIQSNIQLINTYRDVINDPIVLDEVREELSFSISEEELAERITIQIQNDSQIFGIRVTGNTPEQAAELTNLTAETFQRNIGTIINVDNVSILSPARPNPIPVSPRTMINVVVGSFLGGLAGILLALSLYILDKKVYDEQSVADLLGWNSLGSITEIKHKKVHTSEPEKVMEENDFEIGKEEVGTEEDVYKEASHV